MHIDPHDPFLASLREVAACDDLAELRALADPRLP